MVEHKEELDGYCDEDIEMFKEAGPKKLPFSLIRVQKELAELTKISPKLGVRTQFAPLMPSQVLAEDVNAKLRKGDPDVTLSEPIFHLDVRISCF